MKQLLTQRYTVIKSTERNGRPWYIIWDNERNAQAKSKYLAGKFRTEHQALVTLKTTVKLHYS